MAAFGITVKDIQSPSKSKIKTAISGKSVKPRGKATAGATVAAKYKGPEGQTWTGRGLTPRWLKTLIDSGRAKEEFLIQP
jgi:DNA-binding protein H-NS